MDNSSYISFCRNATCNLKDFPRLEGEENDRGRFLRAIDNTPSGGILLIPPGKYLADRIEIAREISLIGLGEVEILSTEPNQDILQVIGAADTTHFQLESPAFRGDGGVTLTVEPGEVLKPGDMVVLTEELASQNPEVSRNIEVHEIDAVKGKTVVFRDTVYLPKVPAEVNLYRVFPLNNVCIENIRVQLQEGSETGRGLLCNFVRNLTVREFHGKRMAGSLIQVRKAMYALVEKFSNESPQKTGSGQGYGVQFYGGTSFVTIRDGLTKYCRHSIDLEGTYNALVENVVDVEGIQANFVLVHNGWGSDITFRSCRAINSRATGFVVESQGYSEDPRDPYKNSHKFQLYNFRILDCDVYHKKGYADFAAGIFFTVPVTGTVVSGCRIRQGTGNVAVPKTYGIRMWPCNNQVIIENCLVEGYNRALCLWVKDVASKTDSLANKVAFKDMVIRNCNSMAFIKTGELKCFHLKEIEADGIQSTLFETPRDGSFYEFVLDGLNLVNSPTATMFTVYPQEYQNQPIRGRITNIQTDRPYELTVQGNLTAGGKIPSETFYLSRVEDSLYLSGEGAASATEGEILPNGLVQGQRITLLADSASTPWVIHQGSNIRFANGVDSVSLGVQRFAITLEWRKTNGRGYWFEIA